MKDQKRVNYFLPAELVRQVRIKAATEDRSPSSIVAQALEEFFGRQAKERPKEPRKTS